MHIILRINNTFYSCVSLEVDPRLLDFARHHGIFPSTVAYRSTSEGNLTKYLNFLNLAIKYLDTLNLKECRLYGAFFIYHYLFVPCNVTTGTPRPLCSKSCYFYRNRCISDYSRILQYGAVILKTSFPDDCENTFLFINRLFNFANSSKSFEDDCFDIPGMYIVKPSMCCLVLKITSVQIPM